MTKIRKQKRLKTFKYNVNRKRLRKNRTSTGKIKCPEVKEFWENKRSIRANLKDMGLSQDPNQTVGMPNTKQDRLKIVKLVNGFVEEDTAAGDPKKSLRAPRKGFVVKLLEEEATAPRESQLRLPKGLIAQLSYFMDKYKFDYKAMVADRKNYDQLTWRQFRAKIRKFIAIPEQFNEFLASRNLSKSDVDWEEYDSEKE